MDKQDIIEELLRANSAGQWNMSSAFGGAMGVASTPQVPPADMNQAIEAWLKDDKPGAIRQVASTLRVTGSLTEARYEQIMEAIDLGEK